MALQIAENLEPGGGGAFYLMEDVFIKGGLQVHASILERDKIGISNLKLGSLVFTVDTKKIWQVTELILQTRENPDVEEKAVWEELALGGGGGTGGTGGSKGQLKMGRRAVVIYTCDNLPVDGKHEFEVEMGAIATVLKLETSRPVRVRAFNSPSKNDPNPYEFISTSDHLADDGRQMFADGTVLRTRNYSILANMEDPIKNVTYWTFDSIDAQEGPVVLTITYLVQEIADTPPPKDEVITDPPEGEEGETGEEGEIPEEVTPTEPS